MIWIQSRKGFEIVLRQSHQRQLSERCVPTNQKKKKTIKSYTLCVISGKWIRAVKAAFSDCQKCVPLPRIQQTEGSQGRNWRENGGGCWTTNLSTRLVTISFKHSPHAKPSGSGRAEVPYTLLELARKLSLVTRCRPQLANRLMRAGVEGSLASEKQFPVPICLLFRRDDWNTTNMSWMEGILCFKAVTSRNTTWWSFARSLWI